VDEKLATATTQTLFDRVLVDAECSSDGAIRHIQKRQSSTVLKEAAWTDSNLDELIDLQKRLIDSGYRLLESGGILVYSTCSLSKRQNEEVVNWLLNKYNESFIIPVSFGDSSELEFIQVGGIPGTVRFNPFVSRDEPINSNEHSMLAGGGFFLAKLGKMRRNDSLD
jgi:16S rRNA C967 or C1407 C5-methylase (RsmB/RsmF family)